MLKVEGKHLRKGSGIDVVTKHCKSYFKQTFGSEWCLSPGRYLECLPQRKCTVPTLFLFPDKQAR